MVDTRYNGWTNYETWNVALWIDNDEGSQSYWRERAEETYRETSADKTFTRRENAVIELADAIKSETEDGAPELTGFYADLLNAALSEVDYHEIAEHFLDDDLCAEIDAEESTDDNDD